MKLSIAVALPFLLLAGCDDTENVSRSPTTEGVASPAPAPVAAGEVAKANGLELTLLSVKVAKQIGVDGITPKLGADETYVVARYSIKNISTKPMGMMEWPKLDLIDSRGASYVADDGASAMALALSTADSSVSTDLNPGVSTKWITVWKIAAAGFDKKTWKVVAETDPRLTFSLE